jgi:hypothetical protein
MFMQPTGNRYIITIRLKYVSGFLKKIQIQKFAEDPKQAEKLADIAVSQFGNVADYKIIAIEQIKYENEPFIFP